MIGQRAEGKNQRYRKEETGKVKRKRSEVAL
jgi:hypothetical protein